MPVKNVLKGGLIWLLTLAGALQISAQSAVFVEFHAQLTDIEENPITEDSCELMITLVDQLSGETLYTATTHTATDAQGWIGLDLGKQLIRAGLKLQLVFKPTAATKWLEQGDKFSINYRFEKGNGLNGVAVVRSEGTELELITVNGASIFSDPYPFAYIKGGFLLSKAPVPEQVLALRQKIDAGYELPSRGVKGGFAVGGYNKQ